MSRYLEYEISSGRILSEVTCEGQPEASEGLGLLEVSGDAEVDTSIYGIRGGQLVRLYETAEERAERERLRREKAEQIRHRLKSMMYEFFIAMMEADEGAISDLRKEYRELKVYMR